MWAKELLCKMQQLENQLEEGLEQLMALVSIEQTDLDALSTDLAAAVAAVGTEIANLEAAVAAAGTPLPAGSLDALKAGVASLQKLEVPAPTPPPVTPPADVPPPAV
jgi:hypothetical protein